MVSGDRFNGTKQLEESSEERAGGATIPVSRRALLKNVAGVVASVPILGLSVGESKAASEHTVQLFKEAPATAARKVDGLPDGLLQLLADDGLIERPSPAVFPSHQMTDESQRGGIRRVKTEAGHENTLIHKETPDGGRLSLLLPDDDRKPLVTHYPNGGGSITQYYDMERQEITHAADAGVTPTANCPNYCGVACDPPQTFPTTWEIWEPCPNCWLSECQRVDFHCNSCSINP